MADRMPSTSQGIMSSRSCPTTVRIKSGLFPTDTTLSSHPLQPLLFADFFFFLDDGHSDRYEVIIIVVLICISLIMNLLSTFSCAFFFKLGYSCFAILCYFLLCNRVNQLFVYVYLLPFEPSSHHSTTISSL